MEPESAQSLKSTLFFVLPITLRYQSKVNILQQHRNDEKSNSHIKLSFLSVLKVSRKGYTYEFVGPVYKIRGESLTLINSFQNQPKYSILFFNFEINARSAAPTWDTRSIYQEVIDFQAIIFKIL